MVKLVLSYISLYLLLFDLDFPFLRGVGSSFYSALISMSYLLLGYKSCYSKFKYIFNEFFLVILIYIILTLYVFIRLIFSSAEELSYLGTTIKGTVLLISSILYLISFNTNNLFNKLFNVFFFNACVALFVGTFQEYQYILNIFKPNGGTELIGYVPYRNAFLSGSGYFGIGAPFSVASSFFLYYCLIIKKKLSILSFIKIVFVFVSAILAARTTFLAIAMSILYLILFERKWKFLGIFIVMFSLFSIILSMDMFEPYRYWIFEIFNDGIMSSATGNVLFSEFIKFPDTIQTWMFGDGKYTEPNGSYYMNTDIGYFRHWFFGGILFMCLIICIPFAMYLKNKNNFFLFLIIPICLLLHFKGVFIYNNPTFTPLLLIISHILYKKRNDV